MLHAGKIRALLTAVAMTVAAASAQTSKASLPRNGMSSAEWEAEQQVSLSAEKLIEILQKEPGLLLEVKRLLVRKAYEQGRLLDPSELTDDAVFRLLREDENARILVTREVADREYVRARPTREERERQQQLAMQANAARSPNPREAGVPPGTRKTQDELEWEQGGDEGVPNDRIPNSLPPSRTPDTQVRPQLPDAAPQNPQRRLDRTDYQPPAENLEGYGAGDSASIRPMSPDELSQLFNVSAASGAGPMDRAVPLPNLDGAGNMLPDVPDEMPARRPERLGPRPARPVHAADNDLPQIRRQPNPYADVPSLYDLYAQVSKRPAVLERFGSSFFRNGGGNLESLPMDLPAGPEYVIGPGDGLNIDLWGGVSQRLRRVVDREGRLSLPEIGTLQVAGRSLGDVQHLVQTALRTQFRDVEADISLGRIRSVRVYVVGDVASPGAYDISSLSSPLNAVYTAGGPTSRGSLRHIRHFRGRQLVQDVDAYDLLLHGVHGEIAGIQSGDTILVPPCGAEVTVQGMVRRPAIYELGGEKSLAEVLELAGGVLPSGTLRHVDVERVVAHENRTMLRLDLPAGSSGPQAIDETLNNFQVQDGDDIRISPILPYAEQTVYLDGHVFHPGKYPFREGMKITDLIHSYNELLPEPSQVHAEVIRLDPPDYTPMVLAFNLADAMDGKAQDLVLKPFDTVRIFGRFDFEDAPTVTVSGEVRDPGDHVTNGATHLRDAIFLAGGLTSEANLDDAQVFRHRPDGGFQIISVNLSKALSGVQADDVLLQPKDRVFVHRSMEKLDPAAVLIQGEVAHPGKYPLGKGMTAAELVQLAGGLKRSADPESADLTTYLTQEGRQKAEHRTVDIAKALASVPDTDVRLRDGDVLTIPQVSGWNDIGAAVAVKGEVLHPGTYGVQEGERLSSVLRRAGGFSAAAYPYGAILERNQVRELQEKNHAELIRRVSAEGVALKLIPETDTDQKIAKEAALMQWQSTLQKLQNTPPSGRMVVHVSSDISKWENTTADLQLRAGDVLTIPKRPNFVMVDGAVYNPTAVTFKPGKNAEWYLRQAGGPTHMSDKKAVFVLRADGSVVGGRSGLFTGGALDVEVRPGDMVIVPEKALSGTDKWKTILQASQLTYAIGVGIQVAKSF